ncbi:MAG: flagellin [Pigmentiphaga sp.]
MSVINTNYLALVSQNNLTKSQNALGQAIERLSSGLRINSAKDDAAGQAIANRFTANVNGLSQASRNANDGISIAQTTEGSLNEINENLQRIRTLSVQAATGSNSQTDLESIQNEIQERLDEIDRVSRETQFNGKYVLGDHGENLSVQVGAHDGQTITIELSRIDSSTLGLKGFNVDGSGRIDNEAATKADLEAQVTGGTWADDVYTVVPENDGATAADVFGQLKQGDTVTNNDTSTVYTYNAETQMFSYDDSTTYDTVGDQAAEAQAAIIAGGATTGTVISNAGGDPVDVKIGADGSLSTMNDEALYLIDGELTVTDTAGGETQATLEDILADDAFGAGAPLESLVVGDKTYTVAASGDVTAAFSSEISQVDLLAEIEGNTGIATYAADLGALYGGTYDLGTDGTAVQVGGNAVYVDSNGSFTDVQDGEETTYTLVDGAVQNSDGEAMYVGEGGALTTDADRAGTRTEDPLAALDVALQRVDDLRSHLGAIQNRFQSTIANLANTVNNLSAARSRIEDADYAVEVSNMTRAQILQQAGTSVLAQANQIPQGVLSLLR